MRLLVVLYVFTIFGIGILEGILSMRWMVSYYRYGIPIFSKRIPSDISTSSSSISDLLSRQAPQSWGQPQEFHPISENELAFRDATKFRIRLIPYILIMRGLITRLPLDRTIIVKGYVNWSLVVLVALGIPLVGAYSIFVLILFVAFFYCISSINYTSQAKVYRRIVEILRDKGQLAKTQL
jgi:hypothetical protein